MRCEPSKTPRSSRGGVREDKIGADIKGYPSESSPSEKMRGSASAGFRIDCSDFERMCSAAAPTRDEGGNALTISRTATLLKSHHLYAFDVDGITFDVSGYGYVMAFVSLECIGVIDGQDFVVAIGDDDGRGAAFDAFLGAGGCARVGTLGSALGITDPAIDGLGFSHVVGCEYSYGKK
jgi:hypothetical protein